MPPTWRTLTLLALIACNGDDPDTQDSDTDPVVEIDVCKEVRENPRPFDASPSKGIRRYDVAADFELPLLGGGTWGLGADWTGCESILIVTQKTPISESDPTSIWTTNISRLIALSPENAVYLFVPSGLFGDAATAATEKLQADIDAALIQLTPEDAAWWRRRLLVSSAEASSLSGWVGELLQTERGAAGFAIDRQQRIRDLGALKSYDAPTGGDEAHPYENRLHALAWEVSRFEREAYVLDELNEVPVTDVVVLDGKVAERIDEVSVVMPDAATMAGFDYLDIDLELRCPDPDLPEVKSCGAGGHFGYVWYLPDEGEPIEALRFVTAYGREGRYLDPSPQILPFLMSGGTHRFRVDWAPDDAPELAEVHLVLHLSDRRKDDIRPVRTIPLWTGGRVNAAFNEDRPPVEFVRAESEKRVELVVVFTGHGEETSGCSELCPISLSVGTGASVTRFGTTGSLGTQTCQNQLPFHSIANQYGDWWTERARWCTGRSFGKRGIDIAHNLPVGETSKIDATLAVNGALPRDGTYGSVDIGSWLVVWE